MPVKPRGRGRDNWHPHAMMGMPGEDGKVSYSDERPEYIDAGEQSWGNEIPGSRIRLERKLRRCIKYKEFLFVLLIGVILFIGCNNNPISSASSLWTQCQGLPTGLPITGFAASGSNLVAGSYNAVFSQAYIFISFDEGSTWRLDTTFHAKNHYPGIPLWVGTQVTFLSDGAYLFAGIAGDSGNTYVSTDGGASWVERDTSFVESILSFAAEGGTIFAGTGRGVFRSTDYGISWSAANAGLYDSHTEIGLAVSGITSVGKDIFACTEGNGIYRSTNGGASWVKVNTTQFDFHSLAPIGAEIFAGFPGGYSNGGVLGSTDNGANWRPVDAGLTNPSVNVLCANGSNLFAGTNAGVFLSSNLGESWVGISAGTKIDSLAAIALFAGGSFLFVGTDESGAWRRPLR
ncbi:MAG: hypothetical protein M1469_08045 [Bacteroidetes bacterium]|nr:hypothetical protein [Bacteroidota bacterium]